MLFCNAAGVVSFYWSGDKGVNSDYTDSFVLVAGVTEVHNVPVRAKYLNIVYSAPVYSVTMRCYHLFYEAGQDLALLDNTGSGAKILDKPVHKVRSVISSDASISVTELAQEIDLKVTGIVPTMTPINNDVQINAVAGGYEIGIAQDSAADTVKITNGVGDGLNGAKSVALGFTAGSISQGTHAVALGAHAGAISQPDYSVCIGAFASTGTVGRLSFGNSMEAVSTITAGSVESPSALINLEWNGTHYKIPALGSTATDLDVKTVSAVNSDVQVNLVGSDYQIGIGDTGSGANSLVISKGTSDGLNGSNSVSFGHQAGRTTQSNQTVAIGSAAGESAQGTNAVAVGYLAARTSQGTGASAFGTSAGNTSQGAGAVALGSFSGQTSQSNFSIAIGNNSGNSNQGLEAIAIGYNAGQTNQPANSVCIGKNATTSTAGRLSFATMESNTAISTTSVESPTALLNLEWNGTHYRLPLLSSTATDLEQTQAVYGHLHAAFNDSVSDYFHFQSIRGSVAITFRDAYTFLVNTTVRRFTCKIGTPALSVGETCDVILRKNGVDQVTLSFTSADAAETIKSSSTAVSYTANDNIQVYVSATAFGGDRFFETDVLFQED